VSEKGKTISQKAFIVGPEGNITLTTKRVKGEEQGISRAEPRRQSRKRHAEGEFIDLPRAAPTPMEETMQQEAIREEKAKEEESRRGMKAALERADELGLRGRPPLRSGDK